MRDNDGGIIETLLKPLCRYLENEGAMQILNKFTDTL